MRVQKLNERFSSLSWPEIERTAPSLGPGDVLILCAGFEDRATKVLEELAHKGCSGFSVLCVHYKPDVAENKLDDVVALCKEASAPCALVEYDRENPAGAARKILREVDEGAGLFVDVSGMSRLLIVQLVAEIIRCRRADRASILYVEAMDYPPSCEEVDTQLAEMEQGDPNAVAMFLSAGVFRLAVVPELSSVSMQGQPIRMVVFPSWNTMQMAAIRSEVQASFYTVVHGLPPFGANQWRPEAIKKLNRSDSLPQLEEVTASTFDYRETLRLMMELYSAHAQSEKIVIAPTGSKMQTLALGLLCGWFKDLQIVYPTPKTFAAAEYTRSARSIHMLRLATFQFPGE